MPGTPVGPPPFPGPVSLPVQELETHFQGHVGSGRTAHSPYWQGTFCRGPFRTHKQKPGGRWDPEVPPSQGPLDFCAKWCRWEPSVLEQLLP